MSNGRLERAGAAFDRGQVTEAFTMVLPLMEHEDPFVAMDTWRFMARCFFESDSVYSAVLANTKAQHIGRRLGLDDPAPDFVAAAQEVATDLSRRVEHHGDLRRGLTARILDVALAEAGRPPAPTIVDLGCGPFPRSSARIVADHPEARVFGLDVSPVDDDRWDTRTNGGGLVPFDPGGPAAPPRLEADVVMALDLWASAPSIERAAAHAFALLRPGGWLASGHDRVRYDFHIETEPVRMTATPEHGLADLTEALGSAGFVDVEVWENRLFAECDSIAESAALLARRDPRLEGDEDRARRMARAYPDAPDQTATWTLLLARRP